MELRLEKFQRMIWARKSGRRLAPADDKQRNLFNGPAGATPATVAPSKSESMERGPRASKGPQPLDPAVPRELITVQP